MYEASVVRRICLLGVGHERVQASEESRKLQCVRPEDGERNPEGVPEGGRGRTNAERVIPKQKSNVQDARMPQTAAHAEYV